MKSNINSLTFIAFDIETTGFNPNINSIIEIGAVKFSIKYGVQNTFSSLIKYNGVIPEETVQIHGITNELIKDAPSINHVMDKFIHFVDDYPLLAHNANFDVRFISKNLSELNYTYPTNPIYDTIAIFKMLLPNCERYSLDYLKNKFNIYSKKAHRGLDDAKATMELFCLAARQNNNFLKSNIDSFPKAIYFE